MQEFTVLTLYQAKALKYKKMAQSQKQNQRLSQKQRLNQRQKAKMEKRLITILLFLINQNNQKFTLQILEKMKNLNLTVQI